MKPTDEQKALVGGIIRPWLQGYAADTVREQLAQALAAEAQRMRMEREPDYCWDPNNWEVTYDWSDRDELTDNLSPGDWIEVRTAVVTGTEWAACVRDGEYPVVRWFDTEEEAAAAIRAQQEEPADPQELAAETGYDPHRDM